VSNRVVSLSLSVLLLTSMLFVVFRPKSVESTSLDWWNPDWTHRKQIGITEKSGYDLTDFPVEVSFEHNGYVQSDGQDIRVIDNGTEIPYCITSLNSSFASMMFEINVTSFATKNIHVYYGNPSAQSPNYPLIPLTILEGNTGHAIIDNRVYIGWDYTSWGWSNPVELWNDFRIDFNRNNDPTDDGDLIRDYNNRQGGIGRHRRDTQAIGLGNYQSYVQTSVYVEIEFTDAKLRVYRSNDWVETTQADFSHMFSPSYTHANYHGGTEQNLIDGEDTNLWGVDSGTWVYNSKENPSWMAFRDSSSGYVLASTGFGIGNNYSYFQGGKEASDWDRDINYCNKTRWEPVEPYDQPPDCRIYWYGDNSNSYTEIQKIAATLNNQPMVTIVPDTIIVPDDFLSIQEAINNANEGDTIFVRNGTYYENCVVNKSVSLIGENKQGTIINGSFAGNVVRVTANNVKITNLSLCCGLEGLYLSQCNSTLVDNLILSNNWGSIVTDGCWFVGIARNYIDNPVGHSILLRESFSNLIEANSVRKDGGIGLFLFFSSNNTIENNVISDIITGSTPTNIELEHSYNNLIVNNTLTGENCNYAMILESSNKNVFFHNNIMNSARIANVFLFESDGNYWDNGLEGNYWSDYNGTDSDGDGIGDTPYVIDANNIDNYPLMNPYWNPADINHDLKIDVKDIYIVGKSYGTTSLGPNPEGYEWNPHCDINEDGKINMKDYYPVCKNYGKTYP